MVYPPPVEPDSPLMNYDDDDEPELDGLRHLSVSTDGTIDSLVSQDENPTPPHSPSPSDAPIVHVSPPGASFSFNGPRALDFGGEDHPMQGMPYEKQPGLASGPQTPLAFSFATPIASPDVPFFGAVTPVTPPDFHPEPSRPGNLAARRAASGKLPNKALLSLQQMRFEASADAGMGLGVGPPSSGLEGVSPGGPGFTFRAAMGLDDDVKDGRRSPLSSPGVENIALDSPTGLGSPAQLRGSSQMTLKMPRSPGATASPALGSEAFKPSLRNTNLRLNLNNTSYSPSSSPLPSPSTIVPSSPVTRSSAFHIANTGPRTPLTPSHLPGAPSLGGGGAVFNWVPYSNLDSPGCPVPPPGVPVERTCYFSDLGASSPSSANGTYLPTPGSERGRTPFGMHRGPMPASPLGQGRFAGPANPFFA
ncbi:hypothetical protein JCM6882_006444 [Rhodosporidiobolus microsporus]